MYRVPISTKATIEANWLSQDPSKKQKYGVAGKQAGEQASVPTNRRSNKPEKQI
jgi:hypothetical protein